MLKSFRLGLVASVTCGAALLSGCATNVFPGGPTPAGILFTSVRSPAQNLTIALDPQASSEKKGEATAMAFFGFFAFGDASMDAAMRDGGIKRVHHVDHEVTHFLYAIFFSNKTIVYGE